MTTPRPDFLAIAVFAPRGRDAALASELLSHAGMEPIPCPRFEDLCREISEGIGIVLLTEEELTRPRIAMLVGSLGGQPAWSDLPIIIFSSLESDLRLRSVGELQEAGNVSFVDRPVQKRSLLAAVRSALRARQRQYDGRRAIEARDQFLAMLGHELRNPLSAIGFAMDFIKDRSLADARLVKYADTIKRQTGHLTRLVDDLLDVSRVTSGKVTLHRERTDLSSLVDRVVEAVRTMAERQGVSLTALPAPESVFVDGDFVRLEQVAMNLVINAIKYTPRGGRIDVCVSLGEGEEAVLSVRDTGVGIPAEHLESIFDLFSQAPTGLDRAMGGLGLGLTLVRAIVAMHGGRVQAQSAGVGRGSEFRVRLPLATTAPSAAAETEADVPHLGTSGVRLVVVEDNTDVLEGLTELLAEAGYSVEGAADGPQGLSRILAHRPIVALVDVGLPGFDGYELARRARTSLGDSIGLIAMTGYGQEADRMRAFEAGFDDHVVKPSTIEEISAAIDRARLKRSARPGSIGEARA
jgi:signal transduction histidine kinase/ActR/RegA family two-component response regulator